MRSWDDRERSDTGKTDHELGAGRPSRLPGASLTSVETHTQKGMTPCGQLMKLGAKLEKSELS